MFRHEMTEEEVRREYRLAKDPENQIKILSDINGETPKKIRRVIQGQSWEDATEPRRHNIYVAKRSYIEWTFNEVEKLKQMVHNKTPRKTIAQELNRPLLSINGRIQRLRKEGQL